MSAEMIEMMLFAKELREIGRDRVDEAFQLRRVGGEIVAIFTKRTQSERAQTTRQAAVDEIALAVGQRNSGLLIGELRQRTEVGVGEREFALGLSDGGICLHALPRAVTCDILERPPIS